MDGTKIKANASRHKAMSYGRMGAAQAALDEKIKAWFVEADAIDAAEDATYGPSQEGTPVPDWMGDALQSLARTRQAKAELEAEARAKAEAAGADHDATRKAPPGGEDGPGPSSGMRERGKAKPCADGMPPDKAQRNFTDPDSRIQPTRSDGFIAGYNAQAAVDEANQIIVAQRLSTNPADFGALVPLIDAAIANLGQRLREGLGRQRLVLIACASRLSSRFSARSSRREGSGNSCCAASQRSEANGRSSALSTTC